MAATAEQLREQWGGNIRAAREAAEKTQAELGADVGVNQSTVAKWERGTIAPADGHRLRLAEVLGRDAQELFSFDLAPLAS